MRPVSEQIPLLSPTERRQRNREEVRQAILEAARAVMREQGVAALSLREVARRVQMQAPSLYAYFPSKMALYDALFLMAIQRFTVARDQADAGREDFWDRVHTILENFMRFAQENPELYQLAFERPVPGFVPSEESMAESLRTVARIERIFDEAISQGKIAPGMPASQARDLFFAVTKGLTSQHMANEPHLPVDSGRWGRLIPDAVALFHTAWDPAQAMSRSRAPGDPGKGS